MKALAALLALVVACLLFAVVGSTLSVAAAQIGGFDPDSWPWWARALVAAGAVLVSLYVLPWWAGAITTLFGTVFVLGWFSLTAAEQHAQHGMVFAIIVLAAMSIRFLGTALSEALRFIPAWRSFARSPG